jgi:hypothetical protein
METVFKKGDKVFCLHLGGWGEVYKEEKVEHTPFTIRCSFPVGRASFTWDGRFYETAPPTLSFTEYTLEGFSQEQPEPLPNPGDIVWVRDMEYDNWMITYFRRFNSFDDAKSRYGCNPRNSADSTSIYYYKYLTTENPYANN